MFGQLDIYRDMILIIFLSLRSFFFGILNLIALVGCGNGPVESLAWGLLAKWPSNMYHCPAGWQFETRDNVLTSSSVPIEYKFCHCDQQLHFTIYKRVCVCIYGSLNFSFGHTSRQWYGANGCNRKFTLIGV